MKILRFNESLNQNTPKKGDYVICNDVIDNNSIGADSRFRNKVIPFVKNNIGEIVQDDYSNKYPYLVLYDISNMSGFTEYSYLI